MNDKIIVKDQIIHKQATCKEVHLILVPLCDQIVFPEFDVTDIVSIDYGNYTLYLQANAEQKYRRSNIY